MKKNKNEQIILNSWWKSFVKPLFTFFVIVVPALMIWIFFSNDFPFAKEWSINFSWWIKLLIGFAFVFGTFLITCLCVYIKLIHISIFIFSIPVSICLMVIFISSDLDAWIRTLIIIPFFFLIIPTTICVKKIEWKMIARKQKKHEDIVGYK